MKSHSDYPVSVGDLRLFSVVGENFKIGLVLSVKPSSADCEAVFYVLQNSSVNKAATPILYQLSNSYILRYSSIIRRRSP